MAAVIVELANAVVTEIAAHDWGLQFTLDRNYMYDAETLPELDRLRVDVAPQQEGIESRLLDFGRLELDVPIQIGIRKRFKDPAVQDGRIVNDEIDRLVQFWQDVLLYWIPTNAANSGRRLADMPEAAWVGTEIIMAYSRKDMANLGMFSAFLSVTYRIAVGTP